MKILILYPKFHDYGETLKKYASKEFDLTFFEIDESKIFHNYFLKILSHIYLFYDLKVFDFLMNKFVHVKIPKHILNQVYDNIVVIKCFGLNTLELNELKANKKILYLWDKIERFPKVSDLFYMFDSVYTYDINDSLVFGINHLPLFIPDSKSHASQKSYFMSFIGEYTSYRHKIISQILRKLETENKPHFIKLISKDADKFKEQYILKNNIEHHEFFNIIDQSENTLDLSRNGTNTITERTFYGKANGINVLNDHSIYIYLNTNIDIHEINVNILIDQSKILSPSEWIKNLFKNV